MKKNFTLFTTILCLLLFTAMKSEKPKKIIFFGDSITQMG